MAPFTIDMASLKASMGDDWTFVSSDDTFRAPATIGGNVVHKDMDEELVYKLISAYVATLKDLKKPRHHLVTRWALTSPCKGCVASTPSSITLVQCARGAMRVTRSTNAQWRNNAALLL